MGLCGLAIDFSLTYFFKEVLKINRYVANTIGFITAISFTFIVNRSWTFNSIDPNMARQYSIFIAFSVVGLLINTSILYYIEKKLEFNFYISKFFAVAIVAVWNFSTNYFFTFG